MLKNFIKNSFEISFQILSQYFLNALSRYTSLLHSFTTNSSCGLAASTASLLWQAPSLTDWRLRIAAVLRLEVLEEYAKFSALNFLVIVVLFTVFLWSPASWGTRLHFVYAVVAYATCVVVVIYMLSLLNVYEGKLEKRVSCKFYLALFLLLLFSNKLKRVLESEVVCSCFFFFFRCTQLQMQRLQVN